VVGASPKPERPSKLAVERYLAAGWRVWPVHPSGHVVAGLPCFRSLSELPGRPDIVTMYVNPASGLELLDEIASSGSEILWLNPGAESDELVTAARDRGLRVVRACNLVALATGDPLAVAEAHGR